MIRDEREQAEMLAAILLSLHISEIRITDEAMRRAVDTSIEWSYDVPRMQYVVRLVGDQAPVQATATRDDVVDAEVVDDVPDGTRRIAPLRQLEQGAGR